MAKTLSFEYRARLALTKEDVGELKAAVYFPSQNRVEAQNQLFINMDDQHKCLLQ